MSCPCCHTSHRQPRWGPRLAPKALAPQPGPRPARTERATMCHKDVRQWPDCPPEPPRSVPPAPGLPHALGPIKGPSVALGGWRGGHGHRGHPGVCGDSPVNSPVAGAEEAEFKKPGTEGPIQLWGQDVPVPQRGVPTAARPPPHVPQRCPHPHAKVSPGSGIKRAGNGDVARAGLAFLGTTDERRESPSGAAAPGDADARPSISRSWGAAWGWGGWIWLPGAPGTPGVAACPEASAGGDGSAGAARSQPGREFRRKCVGVRGSVPGRGSAFPGSPGRIRAPQPLRPATTPLWLGTGHRGHQRPWRGVGGRTPPDPLALTHSPAPENRLGPGPVPEGITQHPAALPDLGAIPYSPRPSQFPQSLFPQTYTRPLPPFPPRPHFPEPAPSPARPVPPSSSQTPLRRAHTLPARPVPPAPLPVPAAASPVSPVPPVSLTAGADGGIPTRQKAIPFIEARRAGSRNRHRDSWNRHRDGGVGTGTGTGTAEPAPGQLEPAPGWRVGNGNGNRDSWNRHRDGGVGTGTGTAEPAPGQLEPAPGWRVGNGNGNRDSWNRHRDGGEFPFFVWEPHPQPPGPPRPCVPTGGVGQGSHPPGLPAPHSVPIQPNIAALPPSRGRAAPPIPAHPIGGQSHRCPTPTPNPGRRSGSGGAGGDLGEQERF
ncbi:basic proline-rich protein-like [Ammospiza caudacuta]|uniref:basic proline-rich protein-like n=1 Tax=Ammospiza caudacuta TaxID=2857398 RepID=UPI0027392795|nr:basic proline-rich protein-like [Ammospiza caudacuta]